MTKPGSTDEQLPGYLLALLARKPYTSTACDTAQGCEQAAAFHYQYAIQFREQAARLHGRCRLNHKFTGKLCCCPCHTEEVSTP